MNKLKYVLRDFWSYFFSSRLLVFILFQMTINHFYSRNIIRFVEAANYPISIWTLPFLFQNVYIQFIYGISVVYFFQRYHFFNKVKCILSLDKAGRSGLFVSVCEFF